MEISSTIIPVLGVYLLVSGVFLVAKGKTVPLLLHDFFAHKAIVFLAGAALLFLGGTLAFQQTQETWIRILGVAILIKGVVYILAPEAFERMNIWKSKRNLSTFGVVAILAGIYLLMF